MGLRWPALQEAGIAAVRIDASDEHKAGPGVRRCTMHRAKGLEFRHVLVAGVGDERFPRPADEPDEDPVAAAWHDARQRSLLFVAATRARETLTVVGWGTRTYP